jgi:hypothetical protein
VFFAEGDILADSTVPATCMLVIVAGSVEARIPSITAAAKPLRDGRIRVFTRGCVFRALDASAKRLIIDVFTILRPLFSLI